MKWPWTTAKEAARMSEENKEEIKQVKGRLDDVESIDIIAEELAVLRRNGE